ncbi:DNA internalization-related competence protein ComEC/Rec2 [Alkalibaculum bacchi]|uniref:DNA internalization-related competence protein ComEC/Rec2 n=1 Tax=Alkalibaculum bacchi TaxID=645887 RepID=UPI001A9A4474|nr:DNA internalization-related competence protein ComEC/Rec2 [Alkalibaculum bacchi]
MAIIVFNMGMSFLISCTFILLVFLLIRNKVYRVVFFLSSLFFLLVFFRISIISNKTTTLNMNETPQTYLGRIISFPIYDEDKVQFILQLSGEYDEVVQVFNYENTHNFSYGDLIECKAEIKEPSSKRNPGGFDYNQYLRGKNIYVLMYTLNHTISFTGRSLTPFENMATRFRQDMFKHIENNFSLVQGDFISGLLLGKRSIDDEIEEEFNVLGVSHILSVSGLHVGYVYLFVSVICNTLRLNKKLQFIIVSLLLYFYCFMVGFNDPVMRASFMFLFSLFAQTINKKYDSLNVLCLLASIYIANNPYVIYNVGFQLSYSAVLSIGIIYPYLNNKFRIKEKLIEYIKSLLILTLSVQIGTLPITLYHFNSLSLLSVIANLIIVPLSGFIIIGYLFIFIIYSAFHVTIPLLLLPIQESIQFIFCFSTKLSDLSFAAIKLSPMPLPLVVLYYIFIFYLLGYFYHYKDKNRNLLACAMGVNIFALLLFYIYPKPMIITFLDVGQGDSALIECPSGFTMLIDGGGSINYPVGDEVLAKVLLCKNIREIDAVVATHSHSDHVLGLMEIMDDIKIQHLIINPLEEDYNDLLSLARTYGISINQSDHTTIKVGNELYIEFIYPNALHQYIGANNSSVVIKITYKDQNFLFMGDLESNGEKVLLQEGHDLKSDFIKIGHHGSSTSTSKEFIERVRPTYAIISVGANNHFNHPNKETINLLEEKNIKILRTDLHGAIEVKIHGNRTSIRTYIE